MLSPRGRVGFEAKFYGLDLVLGLNSCWPRPRSRPHEVWPRSHASWPHDLDNLQVDGNYELSISFSVLSLSP